ncbi:MAG: hypothetical protein IJA53_01975 [Spirochaetaceae bacterium]|nr:hypothetical protein [Spirochaetaceae bacterium]
MVSISLQIWHPKINKDEIIKCINLEPSRCFSIGEEKTTPKGTKLLGVWGTTYVSYSLVSKEDIDIESGIEKAITLIKSSINDGSIFKQISSTGGKCSFYISLYEKTHIAFEISSSLIERIRELNIDLGFEFFSDWE